MAAAQEDTRDLIVLPDDQKAQVLARMREHLTALDDILIMISEGEVDEAAQAAEQQLGPDGPMGFGDRARLPGELRNRANDLHAAGVHLAHVLRGSAAMGADEALREITTALQEVVAACIGCHVAFRMR